MTRIIRQALLACVLSAIICMGCAREEPGQKKEETLRLATTTSTYETGLLDHIFPPFEKEHNVKIHIISVGTGKAIKIAENGDVDVILVHARKAEDKFVADGCGGVPHGQRAAYLAVVSAAVSRARPISWAWNPPA